MKELLLKLKACEEALNWAGDKPWEEVYATCHRGDWLLWLFQKTNPDDLKEITLAKAHCANTVRHLMKDKRSLIAVDTAIKFGNGECTIDELNADADAAYAADADAADAAYAADAAAYAADADAADAATATAAAYAAAGAAGAAGAAAAYAKENQKLTADICRKYLPIEIWKMKISCIGLQY